MKKLTYDDGFKRLNIIKDDGSEEILWSADGHGNIFHVVQKLIDAIEGNDMSLIYTDQPEKHMADDAISLVQVMREALLLIDRVTAIASGNKEVNDLIAGATGTDVIGQSGLTKDEYVELTGLIVELTSWASTDITLSDSRVIKPEEIIMRGYEVI